MIVHSKPFINHKQGKIIQDLLDRGQLQSTQLFQEVNARFKKTFNQDLYFTSSGTYALFWILRGLNLSSQDEVILPTYVCGSIYNAIVAAGAKPVLCDVENFWHMSPQSIKKHLTSKTKAILVVNLFGMALDCSIYRTPGVVIINDLCQSLEPLRQNNLDLGDFAFYSFGPTKFITGGYGGGFSVINEGVDFLNYLQPNYLHFATSDLNYSLLNQQLKDYELFIKLRKKIADLYFLNIGEKYTKYIDRNNNSFYRFPIIQSNYNFEQIFNFFQEKKIIIRRGVDELVHRKIGLSDHDFPNAVNSFERTISLPIYPSLTKSDARKIISVFMEYFV